MSKYKICIIGAGLSGIAAGVQLGRKLGVTEGIVIYDEQEDVGGVWQANQYPGCSTEVPGPLYSYSFAPNPNLGGVNATQAEMQAYVKQVAMDYGLYKSLRLRHRVTSLVWDEGLQAWRVSVLNKNSDVETQEVFDIVINCLGGLRLPNVPPEFQDFAGPCMHSAQWDDSVDLEGKTVAVVGNGSSGAQIVPAIVKQVKQLIVYQRNPAWVLWKGHYEYPAVVKACFRYIPGVLRITRACLYLATEAVHPGISVKFVRFMCLEMPCRARRWLAMLGDPALAEKLRPNDKCGCKPPTFSDNYYSALRKSNVEVVRNRIQKVNKSSITTVDGVERKIDVLVLATGFKVQDYFAPLNIRTKGGVDLLPVWKEQGPSLYMGVATSLAPNMFWVAGPNSYAGNSFVLYAIELQVKYILKVIGKMSERGASGVTVKESVEKVYMAKMLKALGQTIWTTQGCNSFLLDDRGVVTTFSPYSYLSRWAQMRRVKEEDFHFYGGEIVGTKL